MLKHLAYWLVTAYFPSIRVESYGMNYIGQAVISTYLLSWSEGTQLKKHLSNNFSRFFSLSYSLLEFKHTKEMRASLSLPLCFC